MNHVSLPRSRRLSLVAAAAVLALTLAACSDDDGDTSAEDPAPTSSTSDASEAAPEAGALPEWAPQIVTEGDLVTGLDFTDTPEPGSELQVATVTEGDGPAVEVGQTITANYFGSVYGEDEPFDESYSSQPFQAGIGVGQLIPGWDQAIPGTPVGSRIIMSIPSDLGYGDAGSPPAIPGGATLFFVIDIIDAA
ncbi:FKBP-type peptidyl-prolyl cis-trans isomerase [Nocardioides sp.]|uniref:FKBP-type peptidyl-prolyl cis-trans isomerase n=1 Tax=Nocardioides sp. TaxID=35761 RepID=UPI00271A59CF|nr:FKBP-type peptidyl-prolyl cis-trans isomerase [Nocardioides sp.]MDO9454647.1 FKBP-type peptidyl-prolyl cis-trans isomerase [Nocardioides sp.]